MNQHLNKIQDLLQQNKNLGEADKETLIKALTDADKQWTITEFKLDRTEKVKKTTAILLEETIAELEQKRKAVEVQNRELEIESALERVRTVAMSMNKTDDVLNICKIMFTELKLLGFGELRNALINFWDDEHNLLLDYDYSDFSGGHTAHIPYNSHPTFEKFQQRIRSSTDAFAELIVHEDELESWKDRRRSSGEYEDPRLENIAALYYYFYSIGVGAVGISTFTSLTEEKLRLLRRFRNVFDLAYRRYIDIQNAEAQAREAQIEAALERVRSRTLAMQRSDELAETAAVLFKQLIALGISPHRLYISIIKDDEGESEFWITDEDGSKISMAYETNLNNNASFKKMFEGWKDQKKSLVIDMKDKELKEYFNYLSSIHVPFKGGLTQKRRWQYISYFSKGFIGMASPDEQPAETLQLLERFAYVFNLTFTRFNDLQVAEANALRAEQDLIEIKAARKKAEDTLSELQATQRQLVQSEKMASLGELTAGIAHEIQNPLNFVNNFSEVNDELISELVDEVDKGNTEEVKAIAKDIKQNLEKINHHGKRADAIVKGMLQHSRKSEGMKEPTDINALCDEYLRLSYHGLRAKDKSFNADFKAGFDESIGKINVVPQDMGRVILNLFNNAFYAVNEKRKNLSGLTDLTGLENYKPLVSIQTKKLNDKIEISVQDNGNGIPQNIVDKIFQPFFTTKPTGQGTGLGLSLAYDIIKAHDGEIKVETKEGAGSEFIIELPLNKTS